MLLEKLSINIIIKINKNPIKNEGKMCHTN